MIHIVGHTAVDHISRVHHLPKENHSTHITDRQVFFGGGAANIAAGIAVLGEAVTLHSCVGDDFPAAITSTGWTIWASTGSFFWCRRPAHRQRLCLLTMPAAR